jgi:hypothetical protein
MATEGRARPEDTWPLLGSVYHFSEAQVCGRVSQIPYTATSSVMFRVTWDFVPTGISLEEYPLRHATKNTGA